MSNDNQQQQSSDPTDIETQVQANAERLDKIYRSVEKTRKYFLATMIINLVVFVLPLVIALLVVPTFLESYLGQLQSAGL